VHGGLVANSVGLRERVPTYHMPRWALATHAVSAVMLVEVLLHMDRCALML
jgi:hypothetical protein